MPWGEGVFSFARGFMGAGIPSTVTTLLQVDNKTTYELTETFFKHLSTGLPKDLAHIAAKVHSIVKVSGFLIFFKVYIS